MDVSRIVIRYAMLAAVVWSVIVAASLAWNVRYEQASTLELAFNTARASFNKDQAYRLWASGHGGVYVPPTEKTPPSPYMAHLPDRDLTTTDGRRLTLMNPAYMLREMMQEFTELYGIQGKITGRVVLNPINTPDQWELDALDALESGKEEVSEVANLNGEPHLRLMRPMYMRESCLKCHGHLGFQVGELRGGVGVSVPLSAYHEVERESLRNLTTTHGGIWLLGLTGIALFARRSRRRLEERESFIDELELSAQVFDNGLDGIFITDGEGSILRVNPMFTEITGYPAAEAVGQTPRLLKSNHHDEAFYQELWQALTDEGRWEGELWNRRQDGEGFAVWENISSVRDRQGRIQYYIAMFRDITEKKESERHIYNLAHYDMLTGLPNRLLFNDRLDHAVSRAQRDERSMALLFLDLDFFKNVNDSLGHAAGDQLLKIVSDRLGLCLREGDTAARLGGDEFIFLLEALRGPAPAERVAQKLLDTLAQPVELLGNPTYVGGSIGISIYPRDGADGETLVKNADAAMYRAKEEGRNRFHFYDAEMSATADRRLSMESALRQGLERKEFTVYFQPKVTLAGELAGDRVVSAEALVRWRRSESNSETVLVPPDQFIPLAEETGLIIPLGRQVLESACAQAVEWNRRLAHPMGVAVNLSGVQIRQPAIVDTVHEVLEASGLPPELLELEVTEGFMLTGFDQGLEILCELKALGVSLSVDDFGTGYSSLSYLKRLPIDRLKIDRSFITDLPHDPEDKAISSAIIAVAQSLNLAVTAEGVESEAQRAFLRELGCDEIQGYLISRPLPPEAFDAFLDEHPSSTGHAPHPSA